MKTEQLDGMINALCRRAGLPPPSGRRPIRIWALSGVERITLADGRTVICKYTKHPFTGEVKVLRAAAHLGIPVPAVYAFRTAGCWLVMLLEDLGDPLRAPTDSDGAEIAASLHSAGSPGLGMPIWDSDAFARSPQTMLDELADLRAAGTLDLGTDTTQALVRLASHAKRRAAGAETPPFGLTHGELHPTSVHIGSSGIRLLDFGMAFTGPGILDLATWQGTRRLPDFGRLKKQLNAYVAAGGTSRIRAPRGGLSAEVWALGWHRLHSAAWLLKLTATDPHALGATTTHQILRRQIHMSDELLS